ncbi:MAG: glycosyltransferase [Deltaproteobacteria bacterium]|nr:glycosyltransferase [Deltaproteobacteria bacterium]
MNSDNPLVSIIVRTKNRPKLLLRAISSIASQDYRPIEVVLVNDGGAQPDPEAVRQAASGATIEVVSHERSKGRAQAANAGLAKARGEFICFLDDDDEFLPDHVSTLAGVLKDLDFKVAYSDCQPVYTSYDADRRSFSDHRLKPMISVDPDPELLYHENYIPFICLMVTREALDKAGSLDTNFELYEDWDFVLRLSKLFSFYHVPRITALYRQWNRRGQMAFIGGRVAEDAYLKVVRKHHEEYSPAVLLRLYHEKKHVDNLLANREHKVSAGRRAILQLSGILKRKIALEREIVGEHRRTIEQPDHHIGQLNGKIEGLKAEIDGLLRTLDHNRNQMLRLQAERGELQAGLEAVYNTLGWKVLQKFQRVQNLLFPPGTIRGWPYQTAKKVLSTLMSGGVRLLIQRVRIKFRRASGRSKAAQRYVFSVPKLFDAFHEPLDVKLSIVIPTLNAGPEFEHVLQKTLAQKGLRGVELVVVDSGSTDETVRFASDAGAKVIQTKPEEFGHGRTRNLGAENATGEFLLFMTQDAIPAGEYAAYQMVKTLMDNPELAAAAGREIPRVDADMFACWQIANHRKSLDLNADSILTAEAARLPKLAPFEKRKIAQLNNIFCCLRKSDFDRFKFRAVEYAEDLDLGLRLLEGGRKLAYLHSVGVIHSHNRPPAYFFKRGFVDSYWLSDLLGYDAPDWKQQGFNSFGQFFRNNIPLLGAACALADAVGSDRNDSMQSVVRRLREIYRHGEQADETGLNAWDPVLHDMVRSLEDTVSRDGREDSPSNRPPYLLGPFEESLERFYAFMLHYSSLDGNLESVQTGIVKLAAVYLGAQLGAAAFYFKNMTRTPGTAQDKDIQAVGEVLKAGI